LPSRFFAVQLAPLRNTPACSAAHCHEWTQALHARRAAPSCIRYSVHMQPCSSVQLHMRQGNLRQLKKAQDEAARMHRKVELLESGMQGGRGKEAHSPSSIAMIAARTA
jgi:hypothetical protein